MPRKYRVVTYIQERSKAVSELHVSDAELDSEETTLGSARYRKPHVIFPVSERYDEEIQREFAQKIADHLNKVIEVQQEAVAHAKLMERIII